MFNRYLNKWHQIPSSFKTFFFRALTLFVIWKSIYLLFLMPIRVMDAPLTQSIGIGTAKTLNWVTNSVSFTSHSVVLKDQTETGIKLRTQQAVYYHQNNIVSIEDACNGLELCVLYIGFILCLPSTTSRKVIFSVVGIIIIYLVNIWRCAGLTLVYLYYPQNADFTHHYVFTFVVYAFIIWLWLLYTKKLTIYAESN